MSHVQMARPQASGDDSSRKVELPANDPQFATLAVHAGEARQKPGDSITDPIFCASTYTFENTQAVIDYIEQDQSREEYGRYGNPGERVV